MSMEWTRRRVAVISLVAGALAISITSMATGVSLRSLVKKEVAKQLSKATGPAGAAGGQGAQGQAGAEGVQGVPGPTYAKYTGTNPPATPDYLNSGLPGTSVNLPVAGRLLVTADFDPGLTVQCTVAASVQFGLYLDSTAVPATLSTLAHNTTEPVHVTGLSAQVPAGVHQVNIGLTCVGAPTPTIITYPSDQSVGAVLLGS
jgi:hypothetical protein